MRPLIEIVTDPAEVVGWCVVILQTLYIWKRPEQLWPRVAVRFRATPPPPAGPLTVELDTAWPIGRAGLVGPSAWLTAPRETAEFAARRAAIAAVYEQAERRETAALRRAGMTKKAGWICE